MDQLSFITDTSTREALRTYRDLIIEHRVAGGLTSLRDPDVIDRRLVGESLILLEFLEKRGFEISPAIDIGSGAGPPGLPIKIARPALRLTLLEATVKKAAFLETAVTALGVKDVQVAAERAEDLAHDPTHRETYQLALARAVAPLPTLVELALPFLAVGGRLATPKGSGALDEVAASANALAECGGEVEAVESMALPWDGVAPTIVIVRKTASTPKRYPRRSGIPAKRPL